MQRLPLLLAGAGITVALLLSGCAPPSSGDASAGGAPPQQGERGPTMEWGLVIHGGAGTLSRDTMTPEREAAYRASLEAALRAGHEILAAGGQALDAVVAAVQVMEDDSLFNAGRGAVFTNDGGHELDAAIMDGPTMRAGAVAGVTNVRSPILLARTVMEQSEHVFLTGRGAEAFAQAHGLERVPPAYFRTEARWEALERARGAETRRERPPSAGGPGGPGSQGTPGGVPLQAAAHRVVQEILPARAEDTGGVIALSSDGQVVWSFNTPGMYRGRIDQDGTVTLGIYGDES